MSPIRATWSRTLGRAGGVYTTALSVAGFLALVAAAFAFNLDRAEGQVMPLAALWAVSVAPILPVLASFLAMGVWSDECHSGRLGMLLSLAVRERDFVFGKFLGVWTMLMTSAILSLLLTLGGLFVFAPDVVRAAPFLSFVPSLLTIAVQGALWSAAAALCSAIFRSAAVSAAVSTLALAVAPRALWTALKLWSNAGATAFGEVPFDAHALDWSLGTISIGALLAYLAVTISLLLIATKCVAARRLVGRGARGLRLSTACVILLSALFAVLIVRLSLRVTTTVDFPPLYLTDDFSPRTRAILSESSGDVTVTCYLSRDDVRFRKLVHLLRALRTVARTTGGVRLEISFVDPRWDLTAAERLAARGVAEDSVIFEKGGRMVVLPIKDGCGERLCASAIHRLEKSFSRRNAYWTMGHGEASLTGYGAFGLSDIVREFAREGYVSMPLDLSAEKNVPDDAAFVVISGPKDGFSRGELDRLDAYLRGGGRLLVLLSQTTDTGLVTLLAAWNLRLSVAPPLVAQTYSGTDVVLSDFADHPISRSLVGSRLVLDHPVVLSPSSAASAGTGVNRLGFDPLVRLQDAVFAAAVERGAGAGEDLAVRPTRLVAVGDSTFALNGSLMARANGNRDFLLNCVAFLSGQEISGVIGVENGTLVTGLDRTARMRLALVIVGLLPGAVLLLLSGFVYYRGHRA